MSFAFSTPRPRRKPALTPLIDVVFLLLVFFMLAAQFGREGALDLSGAQGAGSYSGPPRLVTVLPEAVLLNGSPVAAGELPAALALVTKARNDAIVLRARDGTTVQRLADLAAALTAAGFTRLILVE